MLPFDALIQNIGILSANGNDHASAKAKTLQ
jgi:hypothetical protein